MKNYSIYYSYKNIGDVIIIVFDNEKKATKDVRSGRVVSIYHDEELIGYNIFDVKDIIKIKGDGLIYFPSPELIGVINSILRNEKLPTLDYVIESGYYVAEVIDKKQNIYKLSLGKEEVYSENKADLKIGDKVVIVKSGKIMRDGKTICTYSVNGVEVTAHICTNNDLSIMENDEPFIIDEDIENGKDFFMMGEVK